MTSQTPHETLATLNALAAAEELPVHVVYIVDPDPASTDAPGGLAVTTSPSEYYLIPGQDEDRVIDVGGVEVNGQRVVAGRQGQVAAPTGGTTVDQEARDAINGILAALQAHGLTE